MNHVDLYLSGCLRSGAADTFRSCSYISKHAHARQKVLSMPTFCCSTTDRKDACVTSLLSDDYEINLMYDNPGYLLLIERC